MARAKIGEIGIGARSIAISAENFPDTFERLLGMHNLTAVQAAKLLGTSPQTISYWRNGEREPGTSSLISLSTFFELDISELFIPFGALLGPAFYPEKRFETVENKIRALESLETPDEET